MTTDATLITPPALGTPRTVWNGSHRGVAWEIRHSDFAPSNGLGAGFTAYLYLLRERLTPAEAAGYFPEMEPAPTNSEERWINYDDDKFAPLHWPWHRGLTYAAYEVDRCGGLGVLKVGCDYNHFGDDGGHVTAEDVLDDLVEVIDAALKQTPALGRPT